MSKSNWNNQISTWQASGKRSLIPSYLKTAKPDGISNNTRITPPFPNWAAGKAEFKQIKASGITRKNVS